MSKRRKHSHRTPRVELLEPRALLATLIVNTAADENSQADNSLSLREAIQVANGTLPIASLSAGERSQISGSLTFPAPNNILFNIPGVGIQTISVASPLPAIVRPVNIDATSQTGSTLNPVAEVNVDVAGPTVRIDGHALALANPGLVADGFDINSPNCTLVGVIVTGFTGAGVSISGIGSQGNWLYDDIIGTLPDTTNGKFFSTDPTLRNGVGVSITSSNNRLGGNNPTLENVIANNTIGLTISTVHGTGNLIQNNNILDNVQQGVLVSSSNNTIGEALSGGGNTISGNGLQGLLITGVGAQGNQVAGNNIGTDLGIVNGVRPKGIDARPNGSEGIRIQDSPKNTIGSLIAAGKNVIGGNNLDGVVIDGPASTGNRLLNNWIGFNIISGAESLFIPNQNGVVLSNSASYNIIGNGTAAGADVIDNNRFDGILISGVGTLGNTFTGNIVGLNPDGGSAFGNAQDGIHIDNSPGNIIGGTAAGAGNTISSNNNGVVIVGQTATGTVLLGNFIGTATDGVNMLGNAVDGVLINNAPLNTVGGTAAGAGNVISGNNRGVVITGVLATDNMVLGNFIGTDLTAKVNVHNQIDGILITGGAANTTVGGSIAGAGNSIDYNAGSGVYVDTGTANAIRGNGIYQNTGPGIYLNPANNANKLQPAPTLTAASPNGPGVNVQGTLAAAPVVTYTIEFFASASKDSSGFGQGQTFLGSTTVTTDAMGNATFKTDVATPVVSGQFVTATATDPQGNTSQFSNAIPAVPAQLQFSAATYAVNEADGAATITVTRAGGSGGTVSVNFATSAGTANPGVDYTDKSGTLFFLPNVSTQTFTIPIFDAKKVGGSLTVNITLSNALNGALLGSPATSTLTINDNDSPGLSFTSATYALDQTAGALSVTVTRNTPIGISTVDYATANGTAVAGVNYTSTHGTLVFNPGDTTRTFSIPVLDDNRIHGPLTFNMALSNPSAGSIVSSPSAAVVTLNDTDLAGSIQFGSSVASSAPGAFAAVLTVYRLGGKAGTVTVNYTTVAGTAKPGVDYTTTAGTLSFAPGVTSRTIAVPVLNTSSSAANVTFGLKLSNPGGGATLNRLTSVTVTIQHGSSGGGGGSGGGGSGGQNSPTITRLVPVANGAGTTDLVVSFSKPMDARTASNIGFYGYFVLTPGRDGVFGTYDDGTDAITAATYIASTSQTVLHLASPLPLGPTYEVVFDRNAFPRPFQGLSDVAGNVLNGSGAGAGSPYVAFFSQGRGSSYTVRPGSITSAGGPRIMALASATSGNVAPLSTQGPASGANTVASTVNPRRPAVTIAIPSPSHGRRTPWRG